MRKISKYEWEPIYEMCETSNLTKLETKLAEDNKTLLDIEKDYLQDNNRFKQEYFDAKRVFLENKYLFCWFIIKHYTEIIFVSDYAFSYSPDYQKMQMKEDGWIFPIQCKNFRIVVSGQTEETIEEKYMQYFNKYFNRLFGFNIGQKNSRIDRYYKQAINCYQTNNFYSCAISLFPIIESIHQLLTQFDDNTFYKIKNNVDKASERIKSIKKIFNTNENYFKNIVEPLNDLITNHYFNVSLDRQNEPKIINRNRIMHGLFSREITQKDCLQLFCVVSNMMVLKAIIDSDEEMNHIEKEIELLKQIKE